MHCTLFRSAFAFLRFPKARSAAAFSKHASSCGCCRTNFPDHVTLRIQEFIVLPMTLNGVWKPSVRGRPHLSVLTRVLETFRLRLRDTFLRILYAPARFEWKRLYSRKTAHRFQAAKTLRTPQRKLNDAVWTESVTTDALASHPLRFLQRPLLGGNVVPYPEISEAEEIPAKLLLERLCIDPESFFFSDCQKRTLDDGEIVVTAEIPSMPFVTSSGLCLAEAGRQLSQLGLVAVSACDPRRGDAFYIATSASMQPFHTEIDSRDPTLKGRVSCKTGSLKAFV